MKEWLGHRDNRFYLVSPQGFQCPVPDFTCVQVLAAGRRANDLVDVGPI